MIGKTILHYKITEKLGEGGMGVVYKAEDTKLERTVALKFLSQSLIGGKDENERFKREAKAAAALNHPNIAHVYAVDEVDGQAFIAMEYVEGQSLEDLIHTPLIPPQGGTKGGVLPSRGESKGGVSLPDGHPLPLETAISYATQIAAGLQAAHEKGIVHRDIKSANIMVTDKGVVKIMDFGLAKLANRSKMTVQGTTLGTAAYMSPEQAQGQSVDHRSDIWSLGVVLYEMISGQMPFKGDYEQAVIYAILHEDPMPLTALRSGLPIALDGIIAKALAKDPTTRYQHVDELPADLKALNRSGSSISGIAPASVTLPPPVQTGTKKSGKLPWIIAALSGLAFLVMATLFFQGPQTPKRVVAHLNITAAHSGSQQIVRTDVQAVALSPDGQKIVYSISEKGQSYLYLRSLNNFESKKIAGTLNGRSPFFSPNGKWIGFEAAGKIKKVPMAGGTAETVCEAAGFRGASWGSNDIVIFSREYGSGLSSISASGGEIRTVSELDSTRNERTHRWPQVLPGGKWVLYTIGDQNNPNSYTNAQLALQSLETGKRHILNIRGEMARYVEPGYLIIARNGSLLAAPFSLNQLKLTGSPITVVSNVDGDLGSGISYFSVSQNGNLLYIPGARNRDLELVLVDMSGKVKPLPLSVRPYKYPRFSPDGKKLSVTVGLVNGNNNDIWIYDFQSAVFNRFTFGKAMFDAVWSRNSQKLYFVSGAGGEEGIWEKPADGSVEKKQILASRIPLYPISVTPDGSRLILNRTGGPTQGEISTLDLKKRQQNKPLFSAKAYHYNGNISPDGKYIAYGSNETGRLEIMVRSYPDLKGKWQVSTEGGSSPLWAPDGRKIYYVRPSGELIAVPINRSGRLTVGKPAVVFDISRMFFPNDPVPNYDLSPDGKQFVMIRNVNYNANTTSFNIVLNWLDQLKERLAKND